MNVLMMVVAAAFLWDRVDFLTGAMAILAAAVSGYITKDMEDRRDD